MGRTAEEEALDEAEALLEQLEASQAREARLKVRLDELGRDKVALEADAVVLTESLQLAAERISAAEEQAQAADARRDAAREREGAAEQRAARVERRLEKAEGRLRDALKQHTAAIGEIELLQTALERGDVSLESSLERKHRAACAEMAGVIETQQRLLLDLENSQLRGEAKRREEENEAKADWEDAKEEEEERRRRNVREAAEEEEEEEEEVRRELPPIPKKPVIVLGGLKSQKARRLERQRLRQRQQQRPSALSPISDANEGKEDAAGVDSDSDVLAQGRKDTVAAGGAMDDAGRTGDSDGDGGGGSDAENHQARDQVQEICGNLWCYKVDKSGEKASSLGGDTRVEAHVRHPKVGQKTQNTNPPVPLKKAHTPKKLARVGVKVNADDL